MWRAASSVPTLESRSPSRLRELHEGLAGVITEYAPMEAAVEETFVNRDPQSALKLGQARGIALVVPALAGLPVAEYAANLIKKTVIGTGHAEKAQIAMMVKTLLPGSDSQGADAADALAVAITHARIRAGAQAGSWRQDFTRTRKADRLEGENSLARLRIFV